LFSPPPPPLGEGNNSWPLAAFSAFLYRSQTMKDCNKAAAFASFLYYTQFDPRATQLASMRGYIITSTEDALKRQFLNQLKAFTCNGVTVSQVANCVNNGELCSNVGTCTNNACVCHSGLTGQYCERLVSNNTLAIALGVALPVGSVLLCCLALLFVAFGILYRRKNQTKELLLAEPWSDYSSESLELDDLSSYEYQPHLDRVPINTHNTHTHTHTHNTKI
jgi:hypothetical protein